MANEERPLITFALFAYNQENYIRAAIEGAFAQTYSPLEIILSDDCSSDGTFEVMKQAAKEYRGPHRVVLNRNTKNLNIGGHVNTVAQLVGGDLIILAAGDDISHPVRTTRLAERWFELGRQPAVLCSDFEAIDFASQPINLFSETIYRGHYGKENMARGDVRVLGATTAVSRKVFSEFPPIQSSVRHEDRVLPFRALLLGGTVSLVDEKLVRYRVEGGISRGKVQTAHEYFFVKLPALLVRTLPDAWQRLSDLEVVAPNDLELRNYCLATIRDHEVRLDLILKKGLGVEVVLLKGLCGIANPSELFKFYLKRRFYPIYDIYFHYKYRRRLI